MNNEDCNDRDALIASYLADDPDFARDLVEKALNTVLEGEMTDLLGCEKGERSASRRGYRSGYYTRQLTMKVGTIELRVPQDRDGRFSTRVFERYRRSEKALMSTLARDVCTRRLRRHTVCRKVSKLAEGLCGHDFSHTTISNKVAELDEAIQASASGRLDDTALPYVMLDARYEKVLGDIETGGKTTSKLAVI
ncbi:MAG: transposase [Gammaproteobacteria bacterium]|nr:transposase [Gammaproteobacteria bacterium]